MSAKTLTKKALEALYSPFAETITVATEALVAADSAMQACRLAVGRTVAETVSALTTAGASAEEAQALILATVAKVYGEVEWKTVEGWVRASAVADSLPDDIRDSFTTEALVTLGRVKPDERTTFAEVCTESGITSVRALREAVKAHNEAEGGTERAKKRNATQAADAVKAGDKYLADNPLPATDDEGYAVALVMFGFFLGKKLPKFRATAVQSAVEEMLYDGEVAEDEDAS